MKFNRLLYGLLLSYIPAIGLAQTKTDYFYLGDYINSKLLGYQTQTNTNGTTTYVDFGLNQSKTTPVIGGNIKEGIDGTADTILAVNQAATSIIRFNRFTGSTSGLATIGGFGEVGNFTISSNAKYLYVTDITKNQLDLVNLATNSIVAHASYAGAHDVTLSGDGKTAYVGTYNGSQGAYIGQYGITTDASGAQTGFGTESNFLSYAIAHDPNAGKANSIANVLKQPVGLATDANGDIWVEENKRGIGESIFAFDKDGHEILDFLDTKTSDTMGFTFGSDFGPDGNLYIASLGHNYLKGNANTDGVSGIFSFNAKAALAEYALTGLGTVLTDQSLLSGPLVLPNPDSNEGPKYIKWGSNFSTQNDPGVNNGNRLPGGPPVPEPSPVIILGVGALGIFIRKRKK